MSLTTQKPFKKGAPRRGRKGFVQTSGLLGGHVRKTAESRGFAETKLLTQWLEIVGPEMAKMARPVKVTFPNKSLGGTLTVLSSGPQAPMVQMQLPQMLDRVNTAYGYRAIEKIRVTQTAAVGFAEPKVPFSHAKPQKRAAPLPEQAAELSASVAPVADDGLRAALERLGNNILTRTNHVKGTLK